MSHGGNYLVLPSGDAFAIDKNIIHVMRLDPPVPTRGAPDVVVNQQILQHLLSGIALRQLVGLRSHQGITPMQDADDPLGSSGFRYIIC